MYLWCEFTILQFLIFQDLFLFLAMILDAILPEQITRVELIGLVPSDLWRLGPAHLLVVWLFLLLLFSQLLLEILFSWRIIMGWDSWRCYRLAMLYYVKVRGVWALLLVRFSEFFNLSDYWWAVFLVIYRFLMLLFQHSFIGCLLSHRSF